MDVIRLINQQIQGVFAELLAAPDLLKSIKNDMQQRSLSCEGITQWIDVLSDEHYKVERLEASFAVVGTMKSGKSTTINAIVGTEVLPNRNQPMTTLPTVIRHCPGKKEPELIFSDPEPFNELVIKLGHVLRQKKADGSLERFTFYSSDEGRELVDKIINGSIRNVRSAYRGQRDIFDFLKYINDIWRICGSENMPINIDEYLGQYDQIHKFPAIEVEFAHLRDQSRDSSQGTFALIDTPGPNEAGQTFLKNVMCEQLEKASAVLAVLDYTQLNAEAEADIRKSLSDIANVTGNRLFVFVNKFDQKDRNGMDVDGVRSYVVKQLFEEQLEKEHVYPVSSKYGYLANRALNELYMFEKLPDYRFNPWVEDFGRLALGACWESELEDAEEVKSRAVKLWKNSLFDKPLIEVIKEGSQNAAMMSLNAATAKMAEYDKKIIESLQFRQNALNTDIATIENNIQSLDEEILLVKDARDDARKIIDESTKTLQKKIYQLFDKIEEVVKSEIQLVFDSRKPENWVTKRLDGFIDIVPKKNPTVTFNSTGYNDFVTAEEANLFLDKLIEVGAAQIEPRLNEMQQLIKTAVDEMSEAIWAGVNGRLENVLKSAGERLHETFSLVMDFPKPGVRSFVVDFDKLRNSSVKEDAITKTGTRYEKKWYTLWCRDHEISYEYQEQVYRLYTKDIVGQLQELMEHDSDDVWTSLDKYVRNEFSTAINSYFAEIADYLERFRGDLLDSKHDRELESETLENLQSTMGQVLKDTIIHRREVLAVIDGLDSKGFDRRDRRLEQVNAS